MTSTRKNSRQKLIKGIAPGVLLIVCLTSCSSKQPFEKKETVNKSNGTVVIDLPVTRVQELRLKRNLDLPGELDAYQNVAVHAKVEGFVSKIIVDRGSQVKRGQVMLTISCPELKEKEEEGKAKVSGAKSAMRQAEENLQSQRSKLVEANARFDSDSLTLTRLQQAAKTEGAVAQNDIDMQDKTVEADRARLESLKSEIKAAQALVLSQNDNIHAADNVVKALAAMRDYLTITAPFDGVVTERNVHEGSIVAVDASRASLPLVRVQQRNILRLVVAVPEECVGGLKEGARINFTVPAFLGKTFSGKVARLGYALDQKTRTMPVELDVDNSSGELEPGMFATVHWKSGRLYPTLFVPSSAVATNLKDSFVVLVEAEKIQQVPVVKGQSMQNLVEIVGAVHAGDIVALKASDEFKNGTTVKVHMATSQDLEKSSKQSGGGGE